MENDETPKKKTRYADDLKHGVIHRVLKGEKITDIANELGIPRTTISAWLRTYREKNNVPLSPSNANNSSEHDDSNFSSESAETNTEQEPNEDITSHDQTNVETYSIQGSNLFQEPTLHGTGLIKFEPRIGINTESSAVKSKDEKQVSCNVQDPLQYATVEQMDTTNKTPKSKDVERDRKTYTPEEQQIALQRIQSGEKRSVVSKSMNIPPSTLHGWLQKCNINNRTATESNACSREQDIYIDKSEAGPNVGKKMSTSSGEFDKSTFLMGSEVNHGVHSNDREFTRANEQLLEFSRTETLYRRDAQCQNVNKHTKDIENCKILQFESHKPQSFDDSERYSDKSGESERRHDQKPVYEIQNESEKVHLRVLQNVRLDSCPKYKLNSKAYSTHPNIEKEKKVDNNLRTNDEKLKTLKHSETTDLNKSDISAVMERPSGSHHLVDENDLSSDKAENAGGKGKRTVYKPEEKKVAIRRAIKAVKEGETIAQIARDLMIPDPTLRRWMRKEGNYAYKTRSETIPSGNNHISDQKAKISRDEVSEVPGEWNGWIIVMTPKSTGNKWAQRQGGCFGYEYKQLQDWLDDVFGVFEVAVVNPESGDGNVVSVRSGKILTEVRRFCNDGSSTESAQINDMLKKGCDILVRCSYVKENTEMAAKQQEATLLDRYTYNWHRERIKRESVDDMQVMRTWTDWLDILSAINMKDFVRRGGSSVGFRHNCFENLFKDQKGVFELRTTKDGKTIVKYLNHGNILQSMRRLCWDGGEISAMLNHTLNENETCKISVRCHYTEETSTLLRQLLAQYDYAWNKTLREGIDDDDLPGDWSNWTTVLVPKLAQDQDKQRWKLRYENDTTMGYRCENLKDIFIEKYGIFEMKIGCGISDNGKEIKHDQSGGTDTVVYIGKGHVLTEIRTRCCNETKQSDLIDQALKDGKSISIRACYTQGDQLQEADNSERHLLDRYDYAWVRSKREDVYDNVLPGEWSEWQTIMKPGEVEDDWAWRDERFIGFKVKNMGKHFGDCYGVFEMAVEAPDHDKVVYVGKGKILSELEKYCKINTDGSHKFLQISDALARRCNIKVRYLRVQSEAEAIATKRQLLVRYDYCWNRTKREEVDDSCIPGLDWSEWTLLMAPESNGPDWIRRDADHGGYRLTDESLKSIVKGERGVYEWMIRKDSRTKVVYVGKSENLLSRLTEYSKNGSHKICAKDKDNLKYFNKALLFRYNVYVRFRYCDEIDNEENELLDRYDYAWNINRNDMERDIFLSEER